MSYVRKGIGLNISQLQPCTSRNLVFLQIQTRNLPLLNIVNAYNAPGGADKGAAVASLIDLPQTLWRSAFLAGDFNLHHVNWDPDHTIHSRQAKPFIAWLDQNNFMFTSEVGQATQDCGNTLDLAFLTGPLLAITTQAEHMDVTSNYSPLLTTINWDSRIQEPIKRLRPETVDNERFTDLLQTNLASLRMLPDAPTTEELDSTAVNLTRAISEAYIGSAKRLLGQNTGQPWWNDDCKAAVQENQTEFSDESARKL